MWIKSWLETMIAFIIDCQSLITLFRGYPLLYTVLDSKSTPTKILHPSIKYPTNIAIFAHNQVSKRTSYKRSKLGTWDISKAQISSKKHRIAAFEVEETQAKTWTTIPPRIQRRNQVKGHTDTALEPSDCKALILNSRLKLHR